MIALILHGAGGHARSVADVVLANDQNRQLIFVSPGAKPDEKIFGFPVLTKAPADAEAEHFVAIGDNTRRKSVLEELAGNKIATIIANDAHIGRDATIGKGVFIGHDAYIGPLVSIADGAIINTRSIIEHEVVIGDCSQIAPRVTIGGRTSVGKRAFIGLGASVIDQLTILDDVVIGAGAVVIANTSETGTYVGIPAKKI